MSTPQDTDIYVVTNNFVDMGTAEWLNWVGLQGIEVHITYSGCYGVADGRNDAVREFLASDKQRLWFIDSDLLPPRNLKILDHDAPVVCGPYKGWYHGQGAQWHVHKCVGKDNHGHWKYACMLRKGWSGGPFHADAAGTGCMVIKREVLEKMPENPFYHFRRKDNRMATEDIAFCRDVGGVTVIPSYACGHMRDMNISIL